MAELRGRADWAGPAERSRAAALSAWRAWEVHPHDGAIVLSSPFRSVDWPPGEPLHARCLAARLPGTSRVHAHGAPDPDCRCGIYGASLASLRGFVRSELARRRTITIIGRVLLWGGVVQSENGWRASYAYPERLLVSTLGRQPYVVAEGLAAYGVPVDILDARQTYETINPATHVRLVRDRR